MEPCDAGTTYVHIHNILCTSCQQHALQRFLTPWTANHSGVCSWPWLQALQPWPTLQKVLQQLMQPSQSCIFLDSQCYIIFVHIERHMCLDVSTITQQQPHAGQLH
eukprot:GHUV01033106.1.p1 GENE.GHUV01033106.1~~GHUV01033106.1.p1  ORF type:complete len:106 (-),score=25.48 GHUV01033106.1:546-863(-)